MGNIITELHCVIYCERDVVLAGFMGKVLVEKLLYSCSELDRIYLLLRTKKNVKSEDRLQDIYSSPVSFILSYKIEDILELTVNI